MPQLEPAEIEATVHEFERKLDRLKTLYEQYFLGIAKREPVVPLKDLVRLMRLLDSQQIRNTGIRYRFRNLVQRYQVYRTYWSRTLRAIENGTYTRDLARVRRKLARDGVDVGKLEKMRSRGQIEKALSTAAKKRPDAIRGRPAEELEAEAKNVAGASPNPGAPSPRRATASSGPPLPEDQMQSLYRRLVKAKRMCGEDASSIQYNSLVRTIERQLPKLQQLHKGRDIEFQVVIRKGRAILKARPKD